MIIDFLIDSIFLPLLFLIGMLFLSMLSSSILCLGRIKSKEVIRQRRFFLRPLLRRFFQRHEWDTLHIAIGVSKNIYQLLFALSGFFYISTSIPYFKHLLTEAPSRHDWTLLVLTALTLLLSTLFADFIARIMSSLWPRSALRCSAFFASIYLTIAFPIVILLLHATRGVVRKAQAEGEVAEALPSRAQIKELIRESELHHHLDPSDQKLISSFVNFKERVAKEIMVPRVDIFSLSADTTIRESARLFAQEGYSRIPIYRDSLDQIIGVVLYKDLLKFYAESVKEGRDIESDLESIAKPVLYSPENKKITHLLQEFRSKQIHMAIIVDEYGGTEGIVTIEDILEELVGEIEDEYDIAADQQFWPLPNGGWVVDAKMSINDIEEQIGVHIPQDPDYETIGGYVFHRAGTIPAKGWRLMQDEFDLEVLSSNERSLKKIKILPHPRINRD
jgi:CBS domain containing-hemolysin-like protein